MTGLLDTNVALYLLGGRLAKPVSAGGVRDIGNHGNGASRLAFPDNRG